MNKRAVIEFQIEGGFELEVPKRYSEEKIEKRARAELQKMAGSLSTDITFVRVASIEDDNGGF